MPKESDPARLELLLRLLTDSASNVARLELRAYCGSGEYDDLGLDRLLAPELSKEDKKRRLLAALAKVIVGGGKVSRVEVPGTETLDPATFYEFRFDFLGEHVYVKTKLEVDDPDDPVLIVKSVKRQN